MSARNPPRCTSPRENARRRQPLEVRARLGEAPADALDLPDQEAAADERVQPDAAGDDVAARLFPGDLDSRRPASASIASASISVSS